MSPSFSVVMPAFNAAAFIRDALAALAAAAGTDRLEQVIIVDDASQDATAALAERALGEFKLPGIVLRNASNLGASAARARGFACVESPLIACVDADDLCAPNRFADPLRRLDDPRVQLVGGDLVMFADPRFPPAHGHLPFSSDHRIRMPTRGEDIAAALVFHCPIYASTMTFRRSALETIRLPRTRVGEDWLFAHRIVQAFGPAAVANTGSVLMRYRRHAGQLTRNAFLDNTPVYPVWEEILRAALELRATAAELTLHAKFSPPSGKPAPSAAEWRRWQAWSTRLEAAAQTADYVPAAMRRALVRIRAELESLRLEELESSL